MAGEAQRMDLILKALKYVDDSKDREELSYLYPDLLGSDSAEIKAGQEAFASGLYEDAERAYVQVLTDDISNPQAWVGLLEVYVQEGCWEVALTMIDQTPFDTNHDRSFGSQANYKHWLNLNERVFQHEQQWSELIEVYSKLIGLEEDPAALWMKRAFIFEKWVNV